MSAVTGSPQRTGPDVPHEPRGGRLWWQLVRVGFAAGRGAPGDRLRFWALFAAATAVALVALGVTASVATYDGRAARDQARGPVLSDHRHAVALWREAFDAVGEVQHSVIYIEPLKPGIQPPPGLARWPAPGEAMLSPELARAGEPDRITSRYGRYAGTIGKAGLVSPSERLAYVRPPLPPRGREKEQWFEVSGFGQSFPMGETLNSRPLGQLLLTLGALTGVPALALLVVAARVGSRTRDRRSGLLQALGGTWRHRALVNIGEAAVPAAAGTALAVLPLLPALLADIRIPPTGYLLNSADLRAAWPAMVGALAVSFAITLAGVVVLHRVDRAGRATRPRPLSSRVPRWRLFGCAAGIALIMVSQYLSGTPGLVAFAGGTVVMWALLPSVAAVASRRLGRGIAARGLRTGHPGQLIGGRWTVEHPGVVVRLAIAMVIGLGLVCQIQVWNSRLGEKAAAARASEARVGDGVVSVRSRDIGPADIKDLSRTLPAGSHVLTLDANPAQPEPLLEGSCGTLRTLGLECSVTPRPAAGSDARVAELRTWFGQGLRVRTSPAEPRLDRLYGEVIVVAESRGQMARVEQAAYALVPAVNVETLGETWLVGAATKARLNNWVLLFGSLGLALLLLTGTVSAAAEFIRVRHVLAPLSVLTGSHSVYKSVTLWHLTVPLLISTVIGGVVTAWHSVFFIAMVQEGSFSWRILASALGGCALLAVAVGILGGRTASRAARRWRPTAD
ncbi:permease [Streptomyces sp. enrichment culture]|uniref:permease n=1 Tax=Streptomyces sp. enrichment culture TaxID=1795815 RepID=UPI003F5673DF